MFLMLIDNILHHKTHEITLIFNNLSILLLYFLSSNQIILFFQAFICFAQKNGFILKFSSSKNSQYLYSKHLILLKKAIIYLLFYLKCLPTFLLPTLFIILNKV